VNAGSIWSGFDHEDVSLDLAVHRPRAESASNCGCGYASSLFELPGVARFYLVPQGRSLTVRNYRRQR
jgi:hypothetical protein